MLLNPSLSYDYAIMTYTALNQTMYGDTTYSDAWRRVLTRLGDYTAIITQALNMRPRAVAFLDQTPRHVLVRIQMPRDNVVLRIAPEGHLATEVFFGRTMTSHNLPAARVLHTDSTRTHAPFDYTIESYIGGITTDQLETVPLLRGVARQVGRTLRRMHGIAAPGWGAPGPTGRWPVEAWDTLIKRMHQTRALESVVRTLFTEDEQQAIVAIRDELAATSPPPCFTHGAVAPHTARCTVGEHVQLEALIDPGPIVGGDGLLDLALALSPDYPEAWRTGVYEGYTALIPLRKAEQERLNQWHMLVGYWYVCERAFRGLPVESTPVILERKSQ